MRKLYAIGEALIDFIPGTTDTKLKDVETFSRQVGGAPCNVASTVQKLGGHAEMVTQLGNDAFGDIIVETLDDIGVGTSFIRRTDEANTALAFVSLTQDGEREFSFYRKPSADMLYKSEYLTDLTVTEEDILHFCSVDLVQSDMKIAHETLINQFHQAGGTIVFDPNVRLPLWDSAEECQQAIRQFIPRAHIVKISDEELTFITGYTDEQAALKWLFQGNVEVVIYTKGAAGSEIHLKDGSVQSHEGFEVTPIDTTGAGDAFIGAAISKLLTYDAKNLADTLQQHGASILKFSNFVAAQVTTKYGAIESIPTLTEVEKGLQ